MLSEIPRTAVPMLSPRAEAARLTLQLRATLQDIAAVEAEADPHESSSSLAALNDRIGALIEQRRHALGGVMAAARVQADDEIARARAEASAIIAAAKSIPPPPPPPAPAPLLPPAALVEAPVDPADAQGTDETTAGLVTGEAFVWDWVPYDQDAVVTLDRGATTALDPGEPCPVPLLVDSPPVAAPLPPPPPAPSSSATSSPVLPPPPAFAPPSPPEQASPFSPPMLNDVVLWRPEPTGPAAVNVVIDADSFARAFAAAVAPILESIEHSRQAPTHFPPPTQAFRVVQSPPPKKSFWANAWHADVLLSAVAVVIVLAVLVAWTS